MKRLTYIDYAKGIGIILVVFLHCGFSFTPQKIFTGISAFHMPLFFIISGLLFSYSNIHEKLTLKTALNQVKKRAVRLLYPYATFGIIHAVIMIVTSMYGESLSGYLRHRALEFVLFYGTSVLWFLPALFFGEAIFIFALLGIKSALRGQGALAHNACLAIIAFGILFTTIFVQRSAIVLAPELTSFGILAYIITVALRAAVAFSLVAFGYLIGIATNYLPSRLKELKSPVIFLIGILILAATVALSQLNLTVDLNHVQIWNPIFFLINALSGSLGILLIAKSLPDFRNKRVGFFNRLVAIPFNMLKFAGKNSLIIMLTHIDWLIINRAVSFAIWINQYVESGKGYVMYIVMAAFIILLQWLVCVIIRRYLPFLLYIGKKQIKGENLS